MRLTVKNISFVKERTKNGVTYGWFIGLKSPNVSDSINYAVYEDGKTVAKEYPLDLLPASVRKFIERSERKLLCEDTYESGDCYRHYIYETGK